MTAPTPADHGDVPAMRLDELPGDREAKAAAFHTGIGLRATPEEQVEDRLALLERHAGPGVDHVDDRLAPLGPGTHGDRASGRGELDRVGDEVVDDRAQLVRV